MVAELLVISRVGVIALTPLLKVWVTLKRCQVVVAVNEAGVPVDGVPLLLISSWMGWVPLLVLSHILKV